MDDLKSYLSFLIDKEYYAANVAYVRSIIEYTGITKVPKMPSYMLGVINLRGEVIPVVDARLKLGMSTTEIKTSTCILDLVLKVDGKQVNIGLLVEGVAEVLEIEKDEIKDSPGIGESIRNEFLQGVYHDEDKFIMILDLEDMLVADVEAA